MPTSPSLVPDSDDRDVYLVLDDFFELGRAWCETDEEWADRETVITYLLEEQYSNPVRGVAFNALKAGRGIFRRSSPRRSPGAAPWTASTCRRF
jgi:hypothetical protein